MSEVGSTTRSAIEAFKGNPACLAAVLLAAMFAVLTYAAMQRSEQRNHEARMAMLERCFPAEEQP